MWANPPTHSTVTLLPSTVKVSVPDGGGADVAGGGVVGGGGVGVGLPSGGEFGPCVGMIVTVVGTPFTISTRVVGRWPGPGVPGGPLTPLVTLVVGSTLDPNAGGWAFCPSKEKISTAAAAAA